MSAGVDGARDAVLARIRGALRDVPPIDASVELAALPRDFLRASSADAQDKTARLIDRLTDCKAQVCHATDATLAAELARVCAERALKTLVVPADLRDAWQPEGVTLRRDGAPAPLTHAELDACDAVLTGCALAAAQTGTIFLDGGAAQGRRAITLLPDTHLCVVRTSQIVDLIPEAIARLSMRAPITLISGPSATSDIELTRVEGVHGPRALIVFIVET
jgi:L-lactate dehydrogenase complex protein LldG